MGKGGTSGGAYVLLSHRRVDGGGVESHFDDVSRRKAKKSGVIGLPSYVSKLVRGVRRNGAR